MYHPTASIVESGTLYWEIHGPNSDWPGGTSLVAPWGLLWRQGEWQWRKHTGQLANNVFGGGIINNSLGISTLDRDGWIKWIVELYYHEVGRCRVYCKRPGDSDFNVVYELLNQPTIMWQNDPTEDHRYYRLEGIYRVSTSASEAAMFMDQNGRVATLNDARVALNESGTGGGVTVGFFLDNFDDNLLGARFTESESGGWIATETASQQQFDAANATGLAEIVTGDGTYDFSATGEIRAELVDAGTQAVTQLLTYLAFRDDASNEVLIGVQNNLLKAMKKVAGSTSTPASVTYALANHRFLRMRAVNGVVYWDYSPDGTSWTNLWSENAPITLTSGAIALGASATSPSADPGLVKWDNLIFQQASSGAGSPPSEPNEFPILNTAQDIYIRKAAAAYADVAAATAVLFDAATTLYVARGYNGVDTFNVDVTALAFDTSGAPDAKNIQTAFLEIVSTIVGSDDGRNLVGEYYTGDMDATAWANSFAGTACFSAVALSSIPAASVVSIPMTGLTNISKTGLTKIRLGVSGGEPAGANYLGISAIGGAQPVARLKLTYIDPQTGGPVTQYYYATSANGFCGGSLKTGSLKTVAVGTRNAALVWT